MRLIGAEPDLLDRFEIAVDQDAEPVDADEALIEFALRYIESTPAGASPADRSQQDRGNER